MHRSVDGSSFPVKAGLKKALSCQVQDSIPQFSWELEFSTIRFHSECKPYFGCAAHGNVAAAFAKPPSSHLVAGRPPSRQREVPMLRIVPTFASASRDHARSQPFSSRLDVVEMRTVLVRERGSEPRRSART